jgi:hypothetical protein
VEGWRFRPRIALCVAQAILTVPNTLRLLSDGGASNAISSRTTMLGGVIARRYRRVDSGLRLGPLMRIGRRFELLLRTPLAAHGTVANGGRPVPSSVAGADDDKGVHVDYRRPQADRRRKPRRDRPPQAVAGGSQLNWRHLVVSRSSASFTMSVTSMKHWPSGRRPSFSPGSGGLRARVRELVAST